MAYEVVMPYHLHMPSYFLETFTEYPFLGLFLMISKIHILRFTPSYCNTDYYLPDKCETYFLITSQ